MSKQAYEIAKKLKNIKPSNGNDRLARSLYLVHSFATMVPVTGYSTAEQAVEATEAELKKIINAVNEHVTIDTRLTLGLYPQVMRVRFELIHGTCDPFLIHTALRSESAKDIKNAEDAAMTDYLMTYPGAAEDQQCVNEAMRELYAATQ